MNKGSNNLGNGLQCIKVFYTNLSAIIPTTVDQPPLVPHLYITLEILFSVSVPPLSLSETPATAALIHIKCEFSKTSGQLPSTLCHFPIWCTVWYPLPGSPPQRPINFWKRKTIKNDFLSCTMPVGMFVFGRRIKQHTPCCLKLTRSSTCRLDDKRAFDFFIRRTRIGWELDRFKNTRACEWTIRALRFEQKM